VWQLKFWCLWQERYLPLLQCVQMCSEAYAASYSISQGKETWLMNLTTLHIWCQGLCMSVIIHLFPHMPLCCEHGQYPLIHVAELLSSWIHKTNLKPHTDQGNAMRYKKEYFYYDILAFNRLFAGTGICMFFQFICNM